MMHEEEFQVALFPNAAPGKAQAPAQKEKRRWEDSFQRWSDQQALSGLTHYGACGYGAICNYCDGDPKGRPCVRALNEMLRTKRLTIGYKSTTYENAFDGEFEREEYRMTDYICRQDFRKELIDTPFHFRCETTPDMLTSVQDRLNDTLELLDNFPPAEVRPVKRGNWIMHISDLFPADSTMECDQCHEEQPIVIDDNFCPNCGADMREEQHG